MNNTQLLLQDDYVTDFDRNRYSKVLHVQLVFKLIAEPQDCSRTFHSNQGPTMDTQEVSASAN